MYKSLETLDTYNMIRIDRSDEKSCINCADESCEHIKKLPALHLLTRYRPVSDS